MKKEPGNKTNITIGIVFILLIIEFLLQVFMIDYTVNISINIVLCIFFNIYSYKRFNQFQTKKDVQLTNRRLALALLVINLAFVIDILIIIIRLY